MRYRTSRRGDHLFVLGGILGALLLPVAPGMALADQEADQGVGSTYAHVRFIEGGLNLQRTKAGEAVGASVNSPVAPGDRAWTDQGRADLALADGSTIWIDQNTRLDVRNLADLDNRYEKTTLIALENGGIRIEATEAESKDKVFQIDTDAGSIYLLSGGSFRIEAEEGITTVSSFRGVAELSGDEGSTMVRTGERSSVRRGRVPADPRPFNTLRLDDFDRFCDERLAAYVRQGEGESSSGIEQELPEEVHPYVNELSVYGGWHNVPTYGWVWRPTYAGGWGPYEHGYWDWYPTGWVWVSYDPWGWAPYHYGRWDFLASFGWVWIPGSLWSGAWVSFAVGPSYVGWCPLDFYNRPVFQNVNIVNVTNINVTRLDARGWRFVPVDRFGDRRQPRGVMRPDRLPRGTDLVVTGRLPRFNPREVASRPDRGRQFVETVRTNRVPLPAVTADAGRSVPFRNLERGRGRTVPVTTPNTAPRAQPRVQQRGPALQGPPTRPRFPRGAPAERGNGGNRERAQRIDPGRISRPPTAAPSPRAVGPGQRQFQRPPGQRPESPRPQVRQPDQRGDHVVERIFDGVRRDQLRPRPAPPQRQEVRPQAAPPGQTQPRGTEAPPQRPPQREHKEKPRERGH
jgi:FecR protein